MLINKAFKFRVYPSPAQKERLGRWESELRWLWNLANEQRRLGLLRCNDDKVYVTYAMQNRELTALRGHCPWLNDVPADLCQEVLKDLEAAWRRFYARESRIPRFKSSRKDDRTALRCAAPKRFRLDDDGVRQFPKLGRLQTVMHRPIDGQPKTAALVREGTEWFVAITCLIDMADPTPRLSPSIGIAPARDRLYATSSGQVAAAPLEVHRTRTQLRRARRTLERRRKGSVRSERAKQRVTRLILRERRQLAHVLHVASKHIAENQGTVVLQKIPHVDRDRQELSHAGWFTLVSQLRYKLAWTGGALVELGAPHRYGAKDDRIVADSGLAAAVRILSAWESLVPARGRKPERPGRSVKVTHRQRRQVDGERTGPRR